MNSMFECSGSLITRCIFGVLSMGPIPGHLSFLMDGNRRFAKKENLETGAGHKAGSSALITILKYCYDLRVKYVTVYAFSIENFNRPPHEVQTVMDLMLETTEGLLKEESVVHQHGIRVHFIGNLKLLDKPLRVAAEKVMRATSKNTKYVLLICVAYSSSDEIIHAVQESCKEKWNKIEHSKVSRGEVKVEVGNKNTDNATTCGAREICKNVTANASQRSGFGDKWDDEGQALWETRTGNRDEERAKMQSHSIIKQVDVEKPMYMAVAPDPDILIRTSGETRLSNFLLWQASNCPLYSPDVLWPEFGLRHLVWAVLNFQRSHAYLEKKKNQL
ncbi:undecaprenyl diphosphate synthase, putative [Ricinus communis]|uniref:Alkyl transferase n=1 Tax=Ricinus communis TaxID=3988 RepID=B9T1V2_RICCO|nr:undecaprenyl diphosphate synthase, putative [Ricinus communis]